MHRMCFRLAMAMLLLLLPACTAPQVDEPAPTANVTSATPVDTSGPATPTVEPTPTPGVSTVLVDPTVRYQTMDGIGACAYTFPYANDLGWSWEAVKYVFDELDLAYLRLAPWLGWWETANDNEDPHTIDWEGFGTVHDIINAHDVPFARYVNERGIELALGVWDFGAADYCETCEDWLAQGAPRMIPSELYPELGESISAYLLHLKANGVTIPVTEVQNEPDIEAGIVYRNPEALVAAARVVVEQLDAFGLEQVMLHGPNLHSPVSNVSWIEAWLEDPVLRERTIAVSYHTWWSTNRRDFESIYEAAQRYDKPVWATEVGYHYSGTMIRPETWQTAWAYAHAHYYALAWSHASRTYAWTILGNDAAVGKQGERYPTLIILKHFAAYIPRGAVLLESTADDPKVRPLVFWLPDGSYSAIVLNEHAEERAVTLAGLDASIAEVVSTTETAYEASGQASSDGLTLVLPPISISSLRLR